MFQKFKLRQVDHVLEHVARWVGYTSLAGTVLGVIGRISKLPWLSFLATHLLWFWLGTLTAAVLVLFFWLRWLHRRFTMGLKETFKGDIAETFDFIGPWRKPEKGMLLVTGSDEGGISKFGAHWENYTLSCDVKILSSCLGVIVRALDLNNYHMLQLAPDQIVPHRRASIPVTGQSTGTPATGGAPNPVSFLIGWQVGDAVPASIPEHEWFSLRVRVRGQSIWLYVDDELALHDSDMLEIPVGKVGFRNWGNEQALVRNLRVNLDT